MLISERRQRAERRTLSPDQRRKTIPSSGPTVILSNGIDKSRKPLSGRSDAISDGWLAYAFGSVTEAEERVSDEMLLSSVAEGDKAAMHIMFTRHRLRVFRFIHSIVRNAAIADDLVSQVFLDVWRSANKFENRARVSTWLLSIARFKAIGALRGRTDETIDQDDVAGIVDDADTPDVALDRKETSAILRACIDKLSPTQREVIDLAYYHERSVVEMSEIVGVPCATVKSRMFYARKHLAKMLVNAGLGAAAV
jgi:RNA polymerase sigma-70 factor, ECF subfamily